MEYLGVSSAMGVPQNGWFLVGKIQREMDDDWGYPYLWKMHTTQVDYEILAARQRTRTIRFWQIYPCTFNMTEHALSRNTYLSNNTRDNFRGILMIRQKRNRRFDAEKMD